MSGVEMEFDVADESGAAQEEGGETETEIGENPLSPPPAPRTASRVQG